MSNDNEPRTWPDLAIGLYDRLTERNAEINYSFDQFEIAVPGSTSSDAASANWKINGSLRISTRSGDGR